MKLLELVIKYKYALIALVLVTVIASASALYNSLSDEYRGDGFAEFPSEGADIGFQGTDDGDRPPSESESGESGSEGSAPETDSTGDEDEDAESGGTEDGGEDAENGGTEDGGEDAENGGAVGGGTSPETGTDGDQDHSGADKDDPGAESRFPTVYTHGFTATDKDGNTVKLSDFVGKTVVLNFWTTWCPYCLKEMPEFDKASKELPDVTFLMLNATKTNGESLAKAKSYIEQNGFEFPVLYDTNGEATAALGVSSYPTTFFIDAKGVIRLYTSGAINYHTILSALERLEEFE